MNGFRADIFFAARDFLRPICVTCTLAQLETSSMRLENSALPKSGTSTVRSFGYLAAATSAGLKRWAGTRLDNQLDHTA